MSQYTLYPPKTGGGGGSGTVTSVSLVAPGIFTVSGSPVTTSGSLHLTLATEAANTVWAGPTTGAAAAPTFRALVAADIPSLPYGTGTVTSVSVVTANGLAGTVANPTTTPAITLSTTVTGILKGDGTAISAASAGDFPTLNQNTTGTAAGLSTPLAITSGGTGVTSLAIGDTLFASATNVLSKLPIGSLGQFLEASAAGTPQWQDSNLVLDFVDDFVNGIFNMWGFATGSGAGAGVGLDLLQTAANPGVVKMNTGTTSGGWALVSGNAAAANLFLGAGTDLYEAIVKLSALSNGTDTYQTDLGVFGTQIGAYTDGISWRYSSTLNGGNWTLNSSKGGVSTQVDSGVAASSSVFVRLGWKLSGSGTSLQGYINGAPVGAAITTNIPTARLMIIQQIVKSAGTADTWVSIDKVSLFIELATSR